MYPYRVQCVHNFQHPDLSPRVAFVGWFLKFIRSGIHKLKNVYFIDQAHCLPYLGTLVLRHYEHDRQKILTWKKKKVSSKNNWCMVHHFAKTNRGIIVF